MKSIRKLRLFTKLHAELIIGVIILISITGELFRLEYSDQKQNNILEQLNLSDSLKNIKDSIILHGIENVNRKLDTFYVELKPFQDYLNAIGFRESGNNYQCVNTLGFMGKYQFGSAALKDLKINVSSEFFLNSPNLQEQAMRKYLIENKKHLKKIIKKYDGVLHNGIYVTESGILAACHLAGRGNVRKYFNKGKAFKDSYGTDIKEYLEKFSGYKLKI